MGTNPCIIGVAATTYRGLDAPEPLRMWEQVVRDAAADASAQRSQRILEALDSVDVVYCQTTQYDDSVQRLADALGIAPRRQHYSGAGGSTPQQLVNDIATRILRNELDVGVVVSGEALATQKRLRKTGERPLYSFRPADRRTFPWEAPFHPAEVAHDVFQAWLTFAMFDNARRAQLGIDLDEYRQSIGALMEPLTVTAAANAEAWFPTARSAAEIATPTASNRLVGYPYTKYMVSVMDVDMAAAVIVCSDEAANALGVPSDARVYLTGWAYGTDPVYVAERQVLGASMAMRGVFGTALGIASQTPDSVSVLDLYSCFPSSLHFALDALETLGGTQLRSRQLTVTGGLPYHGGVGSGYLTHSIAAVVRSLREAPTEVALVTGVGMHMTKHVAGVYSTRPNPHLEIPDLDGVQARIASAATSCTIVDEHCGPATVATYSVVHGSDGQPEHAVLVCDIDSGERCYAWTNERAWLESAEVREPIGTTVELVTTDVTTAAGQQRRNIVVA